MATSTASRVPTPTTRKCSGSGTANLAASTPIPAPPIEPKLQPAWKRGSTVRPRCRSTSAPSTFIATSQTAVPNP